MNRDVFRFTPAAQDDLDKIWSYSLRTWGRAQAERYILSIRKACDALAAGERHGQAIDRIRLGYRKIAVGSHVLFYRLGESGRIDVIRILHQRMDAVGSSTSSRSTRSASTFPRAISIDRTPRRVYTI